MPETTDQSPPSTKAQYGLADVHIHSSVGDGMADITEIVSFVEERSNLDVIAITDHDEIRGSYQARELAAQRRCRFEVVLGTEVTTLEGHLLGLFVESNVPSLQTLEHTIEAIHKQGGLCVVPHPMSWLTRSVTREGLERVMASNESDIYLDGIETVNASIAGRVSNGRASRFRNRHGLAETGGSDAHFVEAVGSAVTAFPGRSAEDLRISLLERSTRARNGIRVRYSDIGFRRIVRQQRKSRGLSFHSMLTNLRENLYEDRPRFPI